MRNHLILGDWNALCDSCGRKFKASSLRKRWDGLMVCEHDFENRHPSDFLRVQRERITVPFSRPYPSQDGYLPSTYICTLEGRIAIAWQAVAGCAIAGSLTGTGIYMGAIAGRAIAGYAISGST